MKSKLGLIHKNRRNDLKKSQLIRYGDDCTMPGTDVRLYPLVFAIALFSIEPAEMQNAAFTPKDVTIIKTVSPTLSFDICLTVPGSIF